MAYILASFSSISKNEEIQFNCTGADSLDAEGVLWCTLLLKTARQAVLCGILKRLTIIVSLECREIFLKKTVVNFSVRIGLFLLLTCLWTWGTGCVSIPKLKNRSKIQQIIWSVQFKIEQRKESLEQKKKVHRPTLNQSQLKAAIESDATHLFTKLTRSRVFVGNYSIFKKAILLSDMRRIIQFYRYNGYYHPKVLRKEVKILTEPTKYRPYRRVALVIHLKEGAPIHVNSIELSWASKLEKKGIRSLFKSLNLDPNAPLGKQLEKRFLLKKKQHFSTPYYQDMKIGLLQAVHELGYALAKITGRAIVDKATNLVNIKLRISPGPRCIFGTYKIVGNKAVSKKLIKRFIKIKEGAAFSVKTLRGTQEALFKLEVFSKVNVKPDLKAAAAQKETPRRIPILIELTEDRFHTIKLGGGFVWDPTVRQMGVLGFNWTVLHFLGGLRKLEIQIRPGLAFLPNLVTRYDYGLDFTGTVNFSQPLFFWNRKSELGLRAIYRRNEQIGDDDYTTITPSVWYSIPILKNFSARFSYNVEAAIGVPDPLEPTYNETYFLSFFEQQLTLDLRDNPIKPTKGIFFALTLQEADGLMSLLTDNFDTFRYLKVSGEMKFFIPLPLGIVWATRLGYGGVFSSRVGEEEQNPDSIPDLQKREEFRIRQVLRRSPLTQRFYLGGANSVRGWSERRLGPLACQVLKKESRTIYQNETTSDGRQIQRAVHQTIESGDLVRGAGSRNAGSRCRAEAARVTQNRLRDMARRRRSLPQEGYTGRPYLGGQEQLQVVPMGGEQYFLASTELRIPLHFLFSFLGLTLFVDAGVVQMEPRIFDGGALAWDLLPSVTAGSGLRVDSPIGALRFDLAFRLFPDRERYPLQESWKLYFSIGEAF